MPYISQTDRLALDRVVNEIRGAGMRNPGQLNYLITQLIDAYMEDYTDRRGGSIKYQTINDIVGAIEGAKLEFYRRIAVPYEEQKIASNGDIYNTNLLN